MSKECRLEKNTTYGKNTYDFVFDPKGRAYNGFKLNYWSSWIRPIKYEPINDEDCLLYFKGQMIPKMFPLEYIEELQNYMKKHMRGNNYYDMTIRALPKRELDETITVGDLLREVDINYLRVGYSSSRTILNACNREALAYAQAFSGLIIFFKKRGGYLCYHISKVGIGHQWGWNNATQIRDLMQGVEIIKDIKKDNLATKIKLTKKFEQKILDETLINSI